MEVAALDRDQLDVVIGEGVRDVRRPVAVGVEARGKRLDGGPVVKSVQDEVEEHLPCVRLGTLRPNVVGRRVMEWDCLRRGDRCWRYHEERQK